MHPRERHGNQRTAQTNVSRRSGVRFLGEVFQTLRNRWEQIQEGKRAGGRTRRHSRSSYHHCPHIHLLPSPPLDAGKYTVPPQVGNLDRRLLTTPVKHRLLLESGRNVSPTGRGPLNHEKTLIACVRSHPSTEKCLVRWKAGLTDMRVQPVTLGEFIGRGGLYFLRRKKVEQRIFSFEDLIVSLARGHILGEKLPPSGYQRHPTDMTSLEDAQDVRLTDFARIATGFEDYTFPPTLNRSAIATLLVDSTPGGMMRAVVACLLAKGILPKAPTLPPD